MLPWFMPLVHASGVCRPPPNLSIAGLQSRHGEGRSLLVLAGLVHDLDHQGRRASSRRCHQEGYSARRAVRMMAGCGADGRLALRIHTLLRATALTNDVNRLIILQSDRLARLLTDADIFASVVYPRQRSMEMTRALKLEQRLAGSVAALNRHFAGLIGATGLQSDMARLMLRTALESRHPSRNTIKLDG